MKNQRALAIIVLVAMLLAFVVQAQPARASPIPSQVYVFIGNYFFNKGDLNTAEKLFNGAVAKDNNSVAHHNLGVISYQRGDSTNAESEFRKAIGKNDGYAKAHNSLALLLFYGGNYEEAAAHFTRAIQLQPDNAQAHFDLGVSLANNVRYNNADMGYLASALEHFKEAEKLQPGYPHALQNIAVVEGILQKYYELKQ
jgi:Flp pilus assembly protein TadD